MADQDWDPTQYLRFTDERLRPALDLLAQIPLSAPTRVVDLGCGPGNVTAILRRRFPQASLLGVDGSPAMLEKARLAVPGARFIEGNFATWTPDGPAPDLIYSNAALHWVGGHVEMFPRLLTLLAPGGILAVQMPAMHNAPLRALQYEVAAHGPWSELLRKIGSAPPVLEPGDYWDLLRPHVAALDIWETIYLHVLKGKDAVGEWAAGSSLRPFLDPLPAELRPAFRQAYAEAVRPHYPRRPDGTTLLPFRRLFLLAKV
jgi:trans-aconitate 2-methyltransferase